MVIYEFIVYVQDEFLNAFFEEGNFSQIDINDKGQV